MTCESSDIEDIKGDTTRNTLPKQIGIKNAGIIGSIALIIAILLSPLPYFPDIVPLLQFDQFSVYYLYIVMAADVIFIVAIFSTFKNPKLASGTLKLGMICALIAFIIGGIM